MNFQSDNTKKTHRFERGNKTKRNKTKRNKIDKDNDSACGYDDDDGT